MNKLCAFFKKYNGIIGIVVFALLAVYAICMATPAADARSFPGWTAAEIAAAGVEAEAAESTTTFYQGIMPFNDLLIYLAIAGIVWSILYTTLRNQIRKVYYISNFVWHGVYVALALAVGIIMIVGVADYQAKYEALPFDTMNAYWEYFLIPYGISRETPVFALGYLEAAVIILSAVPVAFIAIKQAIARFGKKEKAPEAAELSEANE